MIVSQINWGWQAALYLFLGGLSGGTAFLASVVMWADFKHHKKMVAALYCVAFVTLALGVGILLSELSAPLRALVVWEGFRNRSSWMARGAWILGIALALDLCAAALSMTQAVPSLKRAWKRLPVRKGPARKVTAVACGAASLCVMTYTGVLLMSATGIPFWNNVLLPVLFALSALGSGINVTVLLAQFLQESKSKYLNRRALSLGVIALVVVEGVFLVLFFASSLNVAAAGGAYGDAVRASAVELLRGRLSPCFWGLFVTGSLLIPLAASLANLLAKRTWGRTALTVSAVISLLGEASFRFLIVYSGAHTDFVGEALATLLL